MPRRLGSVALASASCALFSIAPDAALAGPDLCVLGPNLQFATCSGNQSNGVRENPSGPSDFPTGTRRLTVQDLTRDISTPFTGIKYRFDSDRSNTPTGSLEYQGGQTILNAGAIGIAMGKNGVAG